MLQDWDPGQAKSYILKILSETIATKLTERRDGKNHPSLSESGNLHLKREASFLALQPRSRGKKTSESSETILVKLQQIGRLILT